MNTVLVHTGYTLMLGALAARDILWLRGRLVVAQSVHGTFPEALYFV